MTIDIEKMQNAALAATQGEWKLAKPQPAAYFDGYINPVSGGELVELQVGINSSYGLLVWKMEDDEVSPKCQANATHIATANPSAILELIEKYKALEAENERFKAFNVELTAKCNWYNSDGARLERERDELKRQLAELKGGLTYRNSLVCHLEKQLAEYKGLLSNLMEVVEEPPESNCSCHISPPCSDCIEWSGLREALSEARTAMKGATE